MPKKPANLLYSVDEQPPLFELLVLALQHLFVTSVGWIFVVVVVRGIGGTDDQAASAIRMSMVASGLATILQSLRRGPVGSGYFCPFSCGPAYIPAAIAAGREGGLPLVFGLTALAGAFEAGLSAVMPRLRSLFPPEVTGLVVTLVGISLIGIGAPRFVGIPLAGGASDQRALAVALVTLAVMIGPTIWSTGRLRLYPVLLGLGVGYAMAYAIGLISGSAFGLASSEPVLSVPHRAAAGWAFSTTALIPFLIASLSSVIKTVGDLTLCQKLTDTEWKRTEMTSVSGGILAGSIGTLVAGTLGGTGQSTFSSNIGLAVATGAMSRAIAWPCGIFLIILAFVPKLANLFAVMPRPVIGAVVVYVACYMILGGIQVMTSRMLDARRTFVIGISLFFGLSVEMMPGIYAGVPGAAHALFTSALSLGTVLAVALNLLFQIGIAKRRVFLLEEGPSGVETIYSTMEAAGAAWGARPDVIRRVTSALQEFQEAVFGLQLTNSTPRVEVRFDEFNLDVEIQYDGPPMNFPARRPTEAELLQRDTGFASLAAFLVLHHTDRVRTSSGNGRSTVHLHFEH